MVSTAGHDLRGILCWVLLLSALSTVNGFINCYRCQHPGPTQNDPCVYGPGEAQVETCAIGVKQCYSKRDVIASTNQFNFIYRGCDTDNSKEDDDENIGGMLIRTRVCRSDMCNDQDMTFIPPPTEPPVTGPSTSTTPNPARFSCYSCTYSVGQSRDCVDHPEKGRTTFCEPPNYCSIFHQYLVLENRINSLDRGCRPRGTDHNGCTKDSQFNTCLTLCNTDLCNTADGANPPPEPTTNPGGGANTPLGGTTLLMLTSVCTFIFKMQY